MVNPSKHCTEEDEGSLWCINPGLPPPMWNGESEIFELGVSFVIVFGCGVLTVHLMDDNFYSEQNVSEKSPLNTSFFVYHSISYEPNQPHINQVTNVYIKSYCPPPQPHTRTTPAPPSRLPQQLILPPSSRFSLSVLLNSVLPSSFRCKLFLLQSGVYKRNLNPRTAYFLRSWDCFPAVGVTAGQHRHNQVD